MTRAGQVNRQVILTSRPVGVPQAEHFAMVDGDVYFDNTFGEISDAVMRHLRVGVGHAA